MIEVTTTTNVTKAKYFYDANGQRVKKESYSSGTLSKTTFYVMGNIYERLGGTNGIVEHKEITISGGGRIGVAYKAENSIAEYNYELTDHLGNVRAVIKRAEPGSSADLVVLSYADYYPFGWQMPGRNQQGDYRYAYQGQEKDPETGWEAFELRMYDGRVGRWMTTDPYSEFHSPYLAMGNSPVGTIDPDGGCTCPVENDALAGVLSQLSNIAAEPPYEGDLNSMYGEGFSSIFVPKMESFMVTLDPFGGTQNDLQEIGEKLSDKFSRYDFQSFEDISETDAIIRVRMKEGKYDEVFNSGGMLRLVSIKVQDVKLAKHPRGKSISLYPIGNNKTLETVEIEVSSRTKVPYTNTYTGQTKMRDRFIQDGRMIVNPGVKGSGSYLTSPMFFNVKGYQRDRFTSPGVRRAISVSFLFEYHHQE